jgi:hypothetical protein
MVTMRYILTAVYPATSGYVAARGPMVSAVDAGGL